MRDEMVRCCRLVQQLTKLSKDFTVVAQDYGKLYQSQFDADPQTLRNISSLQLGAKLMSRAISVLTRPMADHHGYQVYSLLFFYNYLVIEYPNIIVLVGNTQRVFHCFSKCVLRVLFISTKEQNIEYPFILAE